MPDLSFAVEAMDAVLDTATPFLRARLRITNSCPGELIHSIALRCQLHIESARRRYSDAEKAALNGLFGSPDRWATTVKPLPWTSTKVMAPGFSGTATVNIDIPPSCDLDLAAANYLEAVQEGEIPLVFLFSGTVFYDSGDNQVQAAQIPWDREAAYRVPVAVCKQVIDLKGAGSACAALNQTVHDYLERWRIGNALSTLEKK